ncbi:MAG: ABC transporter substrate-binding protein, partial [Burkholderiaceae bacterium]
MQRKDFLKLSAGAAAMLAAPRLALSQSNRPIRLIVPFLATGSTDICARIIAPRLAQVIGREVRIDNVAGKGGMLGARALVEAPP